MQFAIIQLKSTTSTNDDARQAAESGSPEGTVIWALEQKSGRGRQGRVWSSPVGNLYCSIILRPKAGRKTFGYYSFVAALAVRDAVLGYVNGSSRIELKWPNDVLVGDKKISGILLESGADYLIIGMGINVLHKPDNPLYPVTSLTDESSDNTVPLLNILLDGLLLSLDKWQGILDEQGFDAIRAAWLKYARTGAMRIRLPQEEFSGQFTGIDADGSLRLTLPDGDERVVHAGDVFI